MGFILAPVYMLEIDFGRCGVSHLHKTNEMISCMSHLIWSFATVKDRQAEDLRRHWKPAN